jgi:hypothetical protein
MSDKKSLKITKWALKELSHRAVQYLQITDTGCPFDKSISVYNTESLNEHRQPYILSN